MKQMKHYLTAWISASAVRHNMGVLRQTVGSGVKLCPVIKDDCYGHNLDMLYPVLKDSSDGFCAASPSEALILRRLGYDGFILCLLSAYFDDFNIQDQLVEKGITQTVMSATALASVQAAAERTGTTAQVHLKVDTGMGRLGIPARQAEKMIAAIRSANRVELTGIYTHFATADEADRSATLRQLELFRSLLPTAEGLTIHAANTAATLDYPETHFNMVRPGLSIYGCLPSTELKNRPDLKPCMKVTAKLIAVKHLPKGSRSGYGLSYEYDRDSIVGVVPIGYGDGYFRSLSNKAVVRIRGFEAPVRGRVSMDQITIDLTHIPDVHVGDEVEIISADPAAPNSVENLARLADTIPYEITCRMGHTIQHVLVN